VKTQIALQGAPGATPGITAAAKPRNIEKTEQKNAPELPIGRFRKSKSYGGNRVILGVRTSKAEYGDSLGLHRDHAFHY